MIETVWPATVSVPVLEIVEELGATEYEIELKPVPDAALVIVTHETDEEAVHGQLEPVMIDTLPFSPVEAAETFVGDTL